MNKFNSSQFGKRTEHLVTSFLLPDKSMTGKQNNESDGHTSRKMGIDFMNAPRNHSFPNFKTILLPLRYIEVQGVNPISKSLQMKYLKEHYYKYKLTDSTFRGKKVKVGGKKESDSDLRFIEPMKKPYGKGSPYGDRKKMQIIKLNDGFTS